MKCNIHDFDIMKEGKEIGIAIGETKGEDCGRTEARLDAARNMLSQGADTDKIARRLSLPLETVKQLAEELHFSQ